MVPVLVLAFVDVGPVPVLESTLPVLALNGASTGIGIFPLLSNTSMGTENPNSHEGVRAYP
jgi:hypothetical protein